MAALSLSIDAIRPMNRWDHSRIQPGIVGSVGEVNCSPQWRRSTPGMRLRLDPFFAGKNAIDLGANIQDGGHAGYSSGGAQARTVDSNWGGRRHFKHRRGWIMQDLRQIDKLVTPYLSSTGDYDWQNKVATNIEARRTGTQFLPLPGGYEKDPGQESRGGSGPRLTDIAGGVLPADTVNSAYSDEAGYMKMNAKEVVGRTSNPDDKWGAPNYKPGAGRQFARRWWR